MPKEALFRDGHERGFDLLHWFFWVCGTEVTDSAECDISREIGDPWRVGLVTVLLPRERDVRLDEKLVVFEFPVFVLLEVGIHEIVRAPEEPGHCPAEVGVGKQPDDSPGVAREVSHGLGAGQLLHPGNGTL